MAKLNATYRIQWHSHFNFVTASSWISYFKTLGITTLYVSPIMQAQTGSAHGYDVINTNQLSEALGGESGWAMFQEAYNQAGMDILVDFVPNHMAASQENAWWQDVLAKGEHSLFKHFFHIYAPIKGQQIPHFRRFFDINELVCLRMEEPDVFSATHQRILQCLTSDTIRGLRIDHIDGLIDPAHYLQLLRKKIPKPFYLIVEKILALNEHLPANWPVDGTTGYDFMNQLNAVFLAPKGLNLLVTAFQELIHNKKTVAMHRRANNKNILLQLFSLELDRLLHELVDLSKIFNLSVTLNDLRDFFIDFTASLPVYRTYISNGHYSSQDQIIIADALRLSQQLNPHSVVAYQLLERIFATQQHPSSLTQPCLKWISEWQVLTGPLMAKGFEDTTHYVYTPLLSLNEVGSDPLLFAAQDRLADFHTYLHYKAQYFPLSLNASSTHDTKRSEDVRARLNVLSELAEEWLDYFSRWQKYNHDKKRNVQDQLVPDSCEEWFIYQTLLSAFPLSEEERPTFRSRMANYLLKALREAKIHSHWQEPQLEYEQAVISFLYDLLDPDVSQEFLTDFLVFQQKIAFYGMLNSLAQVILKITCPGVADFYQGSEVWHFALTDPDNRGPVNFHELHQQLEKLTAANQLDSAPFIRNLFTNWQNGQIKLYLTYRLLNYRRTHWSLFLEGNYLEVPVTGIKANQLLVFLRRYQEQWLLVIVPRWYTTLYPKQRISLAEEAWGDTQLLLPKEAPLVWHSILTARTYCLNRTGNHTELPNTMLTELPFNILAKS